MSPSRVAGALITFADFRNLKVHCPYVAFMPQWDFLDFLADKARAYPHFRLMMNAEVTGLAMDSDRVFGVHVATAEGPLQIRAELVIGADAPAGLTRSFRSFNSAPEMSWSASIGVTTGRWPTSSLADNSTRCRPLD
ncbi:hypothetical protein MSIMFI_00109 [Mycobacterium simulans]|nr:FAD-dependent monooxygenase [Mycobacterium simulans]SON58631.1 hypothetical protein MSIMFI_00109 [Mycobacterium simulans]